MIKNKKDLLEQCNDVFYIFSLHNWHYPFILNYENDGDKLLSFIGNIHNYCDDTKDEIIFSKKEAEILRSYIDTYVDCSILSDLESGKYDLTKLERQEFKSKLEKLGI